MTTYSVQQAKFELLLYLKEFGAKPTEWCIGTAPEARRALFEVNDVCEAGDIWVWKPTLSPAAADLVSRFLITRHQMMPALSEKGAHVFMFRRANQKTGETREEKP